MRILILTALTLSLTACGASRAEKCDRDGDGFYSALGACGGEDCDDDDPHTYPGAVEVCDGVDNDCDGLPPDIGPDDVEPDGWTGPAWDGEVDEADFDRDGVWDCMDCRPGDWWDAGIVGVDCEDA